jgi:hypothetical protein
MKWKKFNSGHKFIRVGNQHNCYGGLLIGKYDDKYYYTIENYSTESDDDDVRKWTCISKRLANLLIKELGLEDE